MFRRLDNYEGNQLFSAASYSCDKSVITLGFACGSLDITSGFEASSYGGKREEVRVQICIYV